MNLFIEQVPKSVRDELSDFSEILQVLLWERGVETAPVANEWLSPDYNTSQAQHDPFLLPDMKPAIERILLAIANDEHIVIFGDYDADGIPATVILADFFRKIGYTNFSIYIPHRGLEGFGLNMEAVAELKERGAQLIITVDCGSTDVEEVKWLDKHKIDVIITDHHSLSEKVPPALALINPKHPQSKYPFSELSGSGVAFKLVQALVRAGEFVSITDGWEKWLLDMVGIATLADMVPLKGENRVFASYGLRVLRQSRRPGLQALLKKMNINQARLAEKDVTFMIAPRINAASRMGTPETAYALLSASTEEEGLARAQELEALNTKRKTTVATIMRQLHSRFKDKDLPAVLVVGNPDWKPGLAGLIAGKLADEYARASFVWGREGKGVIKGSCRSGGDIDVVSLMRACPADTFVNIGGHVLAGGFSLTEVQVHDLETRLLSAVKKAERVTQSESKLESALLSVADANKEFYSEVVRLAPFGVGNPEPVFLFEQVKIVRADTFGKTNNHLKLQIADDSGQSVEAIEFFETIDSYAQKGIELVAGKTINLYASLEIDTFKRGQPVRLRIVKITV